MSTVSEAAPRTARPGLGTFERYLSLWVALCIIAGIVLGELMSAPFQVLGRMTVAEVNLPVAILIWLMIVPMLLKVDFAARCTGSQSNGGASPSRSVSTG